MQLRRRRVRGLEQQLAGSRAALRKKHHLSGIPAAFCDREWLLLPKAILAFAFVISCSDISLAATGESGFNDIMALICWRRHVQCFKRHVPGCGVLLSSYSTQRRACQLGESLIEDFFDSGYRNFVTVFGKTLFGSKNVRARDS
jgi:hypothetical protein